MAKGDIVNTQVPAPEIRYGQLAAGNDQPEPGDPITFDATGKIIKAVDTSTGTVKVLTHLKSTEGAVGFMYSGAIESVSGAAIQPFAKLVVNADTEFTNFTPGTNEGYVAAVYLKKPSDPEGNPSAAADGDAINVRVNP